MNRKEKNELKDWALNLAPIETRVSFRSALNFIGKGEDDHLYELIKEARKTGKIFAFCANMIESCDGEPIDEEPYTLELR